MYGGSPLSETEIGGSVHAYLAITIGKLGRPFDGIHAIQCLVAHGIPLTLRGKASPCILYDDDISSPCYLHRVHDRGPQRKILPIREACKQDRPLTLSCR